MENQHFPSLLPTLCSFYSIVTAGLVLLTFCLLMQIGRYSPFLFFSWKLILDTSEHFHVLFPLIEILQYSAGAREKANGREKGEKETD